ncbi:MAG: DUF1254 domain-containing protein [Actinobacteria bacterium]|nr:DUF1254 domain-containing protein [Actinomycetota bacterium]
MKLKTIKGVITIVALTLLLSFTPVSAQKNAEITEQEAYEIGLEAYVYLHPIITMDVTRRVMTNLPDGAKEGIGPMNMFHHSRTFPAADMRTVVRPNFDTLYSSAWLDITKEPMIITVPDTKGRYYILPIYDMWTDVFAGVGKRTTGTKAGNYALVPKGLKGKLPKGVEVIESPTPYAWIINRIQTNGPKDYKFVNKLQDGFKITPLSQWGNKTVKIPFKADPSVDMKTPPFDQVVGMKPERYFSNGAELMKMHPPHMTDFSTLARMKRIGIVAGESFDFSKASPIVQKALKRAGVDGLELMKKLIPTVSPTVDGWTMATNTMGVYGNYYMKRAIITLIGLGAIPAEDAIYPLNIADADGNKVVGTNNYVLHFPKDELPPVDAFWSITMYDEEGFQVANELNRFAIGDRDDLTFNKDGSLDIYIQAKSPGKDKESNWLPSPDKGVLGTTMRLYAPKPQALDGRWVPPAIKKVK